jgi:protein tyrosine/serine phosphatase
MPRIVRFCFILLIGALLVGGPLAYSRYRQKQLRNFRIVREGVLYRSGQMSLSGLKRIVRDYGIKTVVTLRDAVVAGQTPPDWKEQLFCEAEDILYVRIRPERWWASDDTVPAEKGVRRFLAVMDNPSNYPVLIHCFAGVHRTGAYCAVYRMEYEHWSNAQAISEMKSCGYINLNDEFDLLGYLERYHPRWQTAGQPNGHGGERSASYWATGKATVRPHKRKKNAAAAAAKR